jgi:DNA-binding MarR family transcriptional regulator
VELRPSATDARERLVALTPRGRRVCAALAPLWAAVERAGAELDAELAARVGAPLSAVLAAAADALADRPFAARVRQALRAQSAPAPPSDPDPSPTHPDTADAIP